MSSLHIVMLQANVLTFRFRHRLQAETLRKLVVEAPAAESAVGEIAVSEVEGESSAPVAYILSALLVSRSRLFGMVR